MFLFSLMLRPISSISLSLICHFLCFQSIIFKYFTSMRKASEAKTKFVEKGFYHMPDPHSFNNYISKYNVSLGFFCRTIRCLT